jgi:NAD(P)-dependent dehydrogenase (short-subunit alcohol dehydrogenase family)
VDQRGSANISSPGAVATVRPVSAGARPSHFGLPPVPREAHVNEIASVALFLAHPHQAHLTGQVIHVKGGAYLGT